MTHHSLDVLVHQRHDDVAAVFESRPPDWLEAFLRLSVAQVWEPDRSPRRTWFRLDAPGRAGPGLVTVPFRWRPRGSGEVFTCFDGLFVLAARTGRTSLGLDGDATAGTSTRNGLVLLRLLELLGSALSAASAASAASADQTALG